MRQDEIAGLTNAAVSRGQEVKVRATRALTRVTSATSPDNVKGGLAQKEWHLIVVNDPKMVNAAAAPGKQTGAFHTARISSLYYREHRRIHRYTTRRAGR